MAYKSIKSFVQLRTSSMFLLVSFFLFNEVVGNSTVEYNLDTLHNTVSILEGQGGPNICCKDYLFIRDIAVSDEANRQQDALVKYYDNQNKQKLADDAWKARDLAEARYEQCLSHGDSSQCEATAAAFFQANTAYQAAKTIAEQALTLYEQADRILAVAIQTLAIAEAAYTACLERTKNDPQCTPDVAPITIVAINSICTSSNNFLTWETSRELSSTTFSIERSADATNWQSVGSIPAAGYSSSRLSYSFKDVTANITGNFYRVVAYQTNGAKTYSAVIASSCGSAVATISVSPNPVSNMATVIVQSFEPSPVKLTLVDSKGLTVYVRQTNLYIGKNQLTLDMSKLNVGLYTFIVNSGKALKTFKLIKN